MPDASISRAAISGVAAEICVEHLFPPDLQTPEMPAGYPLRKVADSASGDKRFAAILARHPDYASFRVGTLCFVLSATIRVNDASVGTSQVVRYIGLSGPDLGLSTEVQDSWQAQAGLYRVNPANQAGRPGLRR